MQIRIHSGRKKKIICERQTEIEAKRAPHIKKLNLRYQTSVDFVNTTDATGTNIPFYVNIEFGTGAGASAPYLFNNPSCTSLFFAFLL